MNMVTIQDNIRIQLLGDNNKAVLSDEYIDLMLSDAKEETGTSTENKSLRYYTCYLIALNWESIGAIATREGVNYRKPEPQKYLDSYNKELSKNLSSEEGNYGSKVSTNSDNIINENGYLVKGNEDI